MALLTVLQGLLRCSLIQVFQCVQVLVKERLIGGGGAGGGGRGGKVVGGGGSGGGGRGGKVVAMLENQEEEFK